MTAVTTLPPDPIEPVTVERSVSPEEGPRAFRGGALRLVGYAVSTLVGVAAAAITFRSLGVDGAGQYVTVLTVFALAAAFTDSGLANVAVRDLTGMAHADRRDYMRVMMGLRMCTGFVGVGAGLMFTVVAGYEEASLVAGVFAGIAVLLQLAQQTAAAPLVADLRVGPVVLLEILRPTIVLALAVLAAAWSAGVPGFVAIAVPAGIIVVVATFAFARIDVPVGISFDVWAWWRILRPVLALSLAFAVSAAYVRATMVVTSLVASDYEVGLFGLAFRVTEVLLGVPILVAGTVLPFLVRSFAGGADRFRLDLGVAVQTAIVSGAGLALTVAVAAPTVVDFLGGAAFGGAVDVLRVQAASLVLVAACASLGVGMIAARANRSLLLASTVGLSVSVAVATPLAIAFGAIGAAIAATIAELVLFVGMCIGLRIAGFLPILSLLRAAVAVGIAIVLAALIMVSGVPNLVITVAAGSAYVILTLSLRLFPWQVQREMGRVIGRLVNR